MVIESTIAASERPHFKELLNYVKTHNSTTIYVYELSRLGRDLMDTLLEIRNLEETYRCKVITVTPKESLLNASETAFRTFMMNIFSWLAERELEMLKERTRNALAAKKKMLKEQGYFISKKGRKITHLGRPAREIDWKKVDEYVSKGISKSNIAKLMDFNYIWFLRKINERRLSS